MSGVNSVHCSACGQDTLLWFIEQNGFCAWCKEPLAVNQEVANVSKA